MRICKICQELKLEGDFTGSKFTCRKCEQVKHKARYKPQETPPTPIPGYKWIEKGPALRGWGFVL